MASWTGTAWESTGLRVEISGSGSWTANTPGSGPFGGPGQFYLTFNWPDGIITWDDMIDYEGVWRWESLLLSASVHRNGNTWTVAVNAHNKFPWTGSSPTITRTITGTTSSVSFSVVLHLDRPYVVVDEISMPDDDGSDNVTITAEHLRFYANDGEGNHTSYVETSAGGNTYTDYFTSSSTPNLVIDGGMFGRTPPVMSGGGYIWNDESATREAVGSITATVKVDCPIGSTTGTALSYYVPDGANPATEPGACYDATELAAIDVPTGAVSGGTTPSISFDMGSWLPDDYDMPAVISPCAPGFPGYQGSQFTGYVSGSLWLMPDTIPTFTYEGPAPPPGLFAHNTTRSQMRTPTHNFNMSTDFHKERLVIYSVYNHIDGPPFDDCPNQHTVVECIGTVADGAYVEDGTTNDTLNSWTNGLTLESSTIEAPVIEASGDAETHWIAPFKLRVNMDYWRAYGHNTGDENIMRSTQFTFDGTTMFPYSQLEDDSYAFDVQDYVMLYSQLFQRYFYPLGQPETLPETNTNYADIFGNYHFFYQYQTPDIASHASAGVSSRSLLHLPTLYDAGTYASNNPGWRRTRWCQQWGHPLQGALVGIPYLGLDAAGGEVLMKVKETLPDTTTQAQITITPTPTTLTEASQTAFVEVPNGEQLTFTQATLSGVEGLTKEAQFSMLPSVKVYITPKHLVDEVWEEYNLPEDSYTIGIQTSTYLEDSKPVTTFFTTTATRVGATNVFVFEVPPVSAYASDADMPRFNWGQKVHYNSESKTFTVLYTPDPIATGAPWAKPTHYPTFPEYWHIPDSIVEVAPHTTNDTNIGREYQAFTMSTLWLDNSDNVIAFYGCDVQVKATRWAASSLASMVTFPLGYSLTYTPGDYNVSRHADLGALEYHLLPSSTRPKTAALWGRHLAKCWVEEADGQRGWDSELQTEPDTGDSDTNPLMIGLNARFRNFTQETQTTGWAFTQVPNITDYEAGNLAGIESAKNAAALAHWLMFPVMKSNENSYYTGTIPHFYLQNPARVHSRMVIEADNYIARCAGDALYLHTEHKQAVRAYDGATYANSTINAPKTNIGSIVYLDFLDDTDAGNSKKGNRPRMTLDVDAKTSVCPELLGLLEKFKHFRLTQTEQIAFLNPFIPQKLMRDWRMNGFLKYVAHTDGTLTAVFVPYQQKATSDTTYYQFKVLGTKLFPTLASDSALAERNVSLWATPPELQEVSAAHFGGDGLLCFQPKADLGLLYDVDDKPIFSAKLVRISDGYDASASTDFEALARQENMVADYQRFSLVLQEGYGEGVFLYGPALSAGDSDYWLYHIVPDDGATPDFRIIQKDKPGNDVASVNGGTLRWVQGVLIREESASLTAEPNTDTHPITFTDYRVMGLAHDTVGSMSAICLSRAGRLRVIPVNSDGSQPVTDGYTLDVVHLPNNGTLIPVTYHEEESFLLLSGSMTVDDTTFDGTIKLTLFAPTHGTDENGNDFIFWKKVDETEGFTY